MLLQYKLAGAAALVIVVGGYIWYQDHQISRLTLVNQELEAKNATLEDAHETQQQTITGLLELSQANAQTIEDLGVRMEGVQSEARIYETKVNRLRQTEAEAALEDPFLRGNAAYQRQCNHLLRFSSAASDTDNPCTTDSNNSPPTSSTGSGESTP